MSEVCETGTEEEWSKEDSEGPSTSVCNGGPQTHGLPRGLAWGV